MTITIQLNELGKCALPEHHLELQILLSKFSEKEVDITVIDITIFSENANRAVDLQNIFTQAVSVWALRLLCVSALFDAGFFFSFLFFFKELKRFYRTLIPPQYF